MIRATSNEESPEVPFSLVVAILLAVAPEPLADDQGRIYVYARRDTAARSWLPVHCDEVVVAELKQGSFFAIAMAPGGRLLSVEGGVPLLVDVRQGEEFFVRLDWNFGINRSPVPVLRRVSKNEAHGEMQYLSYIGTKKVHSSLVYKNDPSPPAELKLQTREKP